jgi:ubiquinone/menaquinone biosynthesis C-methylase UbiE
MTPLAAFADATRGAAYAAAQGARILWFTGLYTAGRHIMGPLTPPGAAPYADEFPPLDRKRLAASYRELFETDWKNIRSGEYRMPRELRRPPSPAALLRASRDYLRDAGRVARRRHAGGHSEVLTADGKDRYPRYYLQNFHYQTDGWLSEGSASRYDMQVEVLFTGAGSAMRRQALPAIRMAIGARDSQSVSLLDIGCGTGSFLASVKDNWPLLDVLALDLSPAYLARARAELAGARNVRFLEARAEASGLAGDSFDIVTAVYLFHELPPAVRSEVALEIARILKPNGALILVDTLQYGDEPGLDILLENFPRAFHEPYYDSYCRTDLAAMMKETGLSLERETMAFLTKVSTFVKA